MEGCGKARFIAADGGTLYLIDAEGKAFMCQGGRRTPVFNKEIVRGIDANGGFVYVLTDGGELWRYNAARGHRRLFFKPPEKGDSPIESIAAYNQGCFAIKADGTVWKYSEFIRSL
jgi:hypothetical protein